MRRNRSILLLEPAYKNKFPPLGLMKIAAYHKSLGDDVCLRKGRPEDIALGFLYNEFISEYPSESSFLKKDDAIRYITSGKRSKVKLSTELRNALDKYCLRYRNKDFLLFDRVYVTTLFTFYWQQTIDLINYAKNFCIRWKKNLYVGGIAASLMPKKLYDDTGVTPIIGLLNKGGELDEGNPIIIDHLTPDYSILNQIDYKYPAANSTFFSYTTRGCIRHCPFCAVPKLEPTYRDYIDIKSEYKEAETKYGKFEKLTLMDNNILASKQFERIVDDIKEIGYAKRNGRGRHKTVDFNQGIDARLLTEEKCAKLAEIEINPLRIAFDEWKNKRIYEKAVRTAVRFGITHLSNYLLYNYMDTPEELYLRIKFNIDLCEELNVQIYSFPMKYHPIDDPEYFNNRDYIGKYWNRKFIRAIQNFLICTAGKIGRGRKYFNYAFGQNVEEFTELLWMPEAFLRNREYYAAQIDDWRARLSNLNGNDRSIAEEYIKTNNMKLMREADVPDSVRQVLYYYYALGDGRKRFPKEEIKCPA